MTGNLPNSGGPGCNAAFVRDDAVALSQLARAFVSDLKRDRRAADAAVIAELIADELDRLLSEAVT